MARIGGRSTWIAVPAGILCVAVVGALGWLALPMVPVAGAWVGDALEAAASTPAAAPVEPPVYTTPTGAEARDCRDLYPGPLWIELTWRADVLLAQSTAPPVTSVTTLVDALAPVVRLTCVWSADRSGTIATTLAAVAPDAAPVVEAGLRGQGFACVTADGVLRCSRTQGIVIEEHVLRDGLWLSSVETGWHPEDYGDRLAAQVWP